MIKYVIWDFNGTILDDRELTLKLLNELLEKQNKPPLNLNEYLEVFGFPIKDYYLKAGLDFKNESFSQMADWFIEVFQPASLKLELVENVEKTLKSLVKLNIKNICLSASEQNNLLEQLKHYNIDHYFTAILGTSDVYVASKKDVGLNYLKENNINPNNCLLIGDTTEDYLVGQYLKVKTVLYSKGHQSKTRLIKSTNLIINNIYDILALIKKIQEEKNEKIL